MDIRQLHYFLVLCEEMNYTRAAQRLFLSRQALRQSISPSEAELCGPLFLSAHHRLSLTGPGREPAAPCRAGGGAVPADAGGLHAEIQSAQPVRIGISVSLVPDYLPGLETQLDKFRQQYPHIEMRFRLLENDAVADGVEQGELDAGLVMDLGTAAPVLARTTLRADPACLLVPRGHPFWEKERVPLSALRGQRVLLPTCGRISFSSVGCLRPGGFAPNRGDRPQLLSGILSGPGAALHLPDPLRAGSTAGAGPGAGRAAGRSAAPLRFDGAAARPQLGLS